MILTKSQIKKLRALAHKLNPVVMLGQNGLTENVLEEINLALDHHELIKIKLNVGDRDLRNTTLDSIVSDTKANCVQQVGNTAVLFRRNAQKPVISLAK